MPSDGQAIVELTCPVDQLRALQQIAGIELQTRGLRTDDPNFVQFGALADEAGQAAAAALGCTVTIIKSAEDYSRQIDNAYQSLKESPKPPDPSS